MEPELVPKTCTPQQRASFPIVDKLSMLVQYFNEQLSLKELSYLDRTSNTSLPILIAFCHKYSVSVTTMSL